MRLISLADIVIPILTFLLGIVFALYLEKDKRKKTELQSNVDIICNSLNIWYNQLYNLNIKNSLGRDKNQLKKSILYYSQNRIVLPRILQSIEILKRHAIAKQFVDCVENFLSVVTDYKLITEGENKIVEEKGNPSEKHILCSLFKEISDLQSLENAFNTDDINYFNELFISIDLDLKSLDRLLQNINREAGRIKK